MLRLNLRLKVLIFTISIIVILLIISHLITSTLVAQNLQEQLEKQVLKDLDNIDSWLAQKKDNLYNWAQSVSGLLQLSVNWRDPFFISEEIKLRKELQDLNLILIENTNHGWIFEINDQPEVPDARIPTFAESESIGELPAYGNAEYIPSNGRIILAVRQPIEVDNAEVGVLTIGEKIDSSSMQDLSFISSSDHIHILLMGQFIASSFDPERQLRLMDLLPDILDEGAVYVLDFGDEKFTTRTKPIFDSSNNIIGHIVVQFSNAQNSILLRSISNALNLGALGAFIAFSLISIFFTGRVTDNLNRLVSHMGALGEGKYEEKLEIDAKDEVGLLARSFEELRVNLKDRTQALIDANRDLDQRIHEIESLNNVMVAIASNLPLDKVIGTITDEAGKLIPCDFAFLALKDEREQGAMRLVANYSRANHSIDAIELVPGKNRAELLETKGKLILEELDEQSEYSDERKMARSGLNSAYYLPMNSQGVFIGALCLASREPQNISPTGHLAAFFEKLATEITVALQRLRLNEELQLIEGRLVRIFDSVRDGIFQTDAVGKIIFLNTAAEKMFGAAGSDKKRMLLLPELLQDSTAMSELLDKLEESGYVNGYEVTMIDTEGTSFDAELSVNYTDDEVGKRGIEGIVRDVTVRKRLERQLLRSEAFLRQVIEGTTNAIFTLDAKGAISFMNHQLADLSDYTEKTLNGMPLVKLISTDDENKFSKRLDDVLKRNRSIGNIEVMIKRKDGTELNGLLSLAPLQNQSEDRQAVCALADITGIKKLEDQLVRSERLASMGQIAASVAHEINNPLGIILGFTQDLISDKSEGDADIDPLKKIEQETERCARIVKDLLDLARADRVKRGPVDLKELIAKTLPLFKLHFRDERIVLDQEIPDSIHVVGDENQLQQILMNVILNSIFSMKERGGELKISLARENDSGAGDSMAAIRISDTGKGIPKEHLEKVFDPFFTTKRKGGSGLGLFIVHRLVEGHGGTISIESEEGKGTTCTITLPTVEAEQ